MLRPPRQRASLQTKFKSLMAMGLAGEDIHQNHNLFFYSITGENLSQTFSTFYCNSFICVYPCFNVIFLEFALVLYSLLVIFSYTRDTCLVIWAFSSHPYYYNYPLLTPLSLHAKFSSLFWWRTMSQVLNSLYYICLISLELDRVIGTGLKLSLGLLLELATF